ncbi:hypothetical protein M440DRAFT_1254948 [Trichoderma longibrachiatum ATCC 18648]|uniref:Uncharacterized protein n=1 Tax=Trichoderma longibrachiatum ATCC 18648 TaxID=983965 RepID=A0A2T4C4V0_TRILO|nr:hypothetical protein M440DRAFT_1254948 [Trichoderma longibrachiatum ATCC 18648]
MPRAAYLGWMSTICYAIHSVRLCSPRIHPASNLDSVRQGAYLLLVVVVYVAGEILPAMQDRLSLMLNYPPNLR